MTEYSAGCYTIIDEGVVKVMVPNTDEYNRRQFAELEQGPESFRGKWDGGRARSSPLYFVGHTDVFQGSKRLARRGQGFHEGGNFGKGGKWYLI
jgi:hypothetical protein